MRKQVLLAVAVLLSLALSVPAMAAKEEKKHPINPAILANQPLTAEEEAALEKLPPAQVEMVRKRELAKQRRDELMKLRKQNIQNMDFGGAPVKKTPQALQKKEKLNK